MLEFPLPQLGHLLGADFVHCNKRLAPMLVVIGNARKHPVGKQRIVSLHGYVVVEDDKAQHRVAAALAIVQQVPPLFGKRRLRVVANRPRFPVKQDLHGAATQDVPGSAVGEQGSLVSIRIDSPGRRRAHVNDLLGIEKLKQAEHVVPQNVPSAVSYCALYPQASAARGRLTCLSRKRRRTPYLVS